MPGINFIVELAERVARKNHDGHLTIFRFTSGWKAVFGTPDMCGEYGRILVRRTAPTLEDALRDALQNEPNGHMLLLDAEIEAQEKTTNTVNAIILKARR